MKLYVHCFNKSNEEGLEFCGWINTSDRNLYFEQYLEKNKNNIKEISVIIDAFKNQNSFSDKFFKNYKNRTYTLEQFLNCLPILNDLSYTKEIVSISQKNDISGVPELFSNNENNLDYIFYNYISLAEAIQDGKYNVYDKYFTYDDELYSYDNLKDYIEDFEEGILDNIQEYFDKIKNGLKQVA